MEGDGLLHPRGPLPPEIYWRRRVIVLAGALALIFLIARCAPDDKKKKAALTGSPSPSTSSTAKTPTKPPAKASTTPKPSTAAATKPAPSPTATTSPTVPAVPVACKALQLSVKASAASYAAGVSPVLIMTIKNAGTVPCTRDLGAGATELKITSGADRIWSSDDCVKDTAKKPTVLKAGEVRTVEVSWNRKRSKPTGECVGADAKPGRYRVQGRLADLLTGQKSFLLG